MPARSKITRAVIGASLLAVAAGCGGGESNETANAGAEQPAANQSHDEMPSGPFAQSEMQMSERMMAATGANASETWARKMIEHHRGAIAMSQILVDQGGNPQFVEMARETITKQQRETAELERLVAAGISGGSGEANPFGPVEQQMHRAMMAATGADLSQTWARKMIAHHQGAVDMSEVLIRQGGNPQVLAMARRTAEDQRREIAHLEAMLRGEGMPAAGAAATSAPATPAEGSRNTAAPATRQPNPAPKATPGTRPAQRNQAAPRPTPRPAPTPTPTTTCTPEHEAMGHCKQ